MMDGGASTATAPGRPPASQLILTTQLQRTGVVYYVCLLTPENQNTKHIYMFCTL